MQDVTSVKKRSETNKTSLSIEVGQIFKRVHPRASAQYSRTMYFTTLTAGWLIEQHSNLSGKIAMP